MGALALSSSPETALWVPEEPGRAALTPVSLMGGGLCVLQASS